MTDEPVLLMIAGPNGSGKSTLTRHLKTAGVDLGVYINPDDIAATLKGSYEARVAEAQQKAEALRQDCLSRHASFSFETVMSHPSKIAILRQARSLGYFNILYFIATESPELNVERVRQRVSLGGHDVPRDRIIERYYRTIRLLPQAIIQCDRSVLFDNTYWARGGLSANLSPFVSISLQNGQVEMDITAEIPHWFLPVASELRRLDIK